MLNGVIFEPGYGSGKQGKERVFITTDELPHVSAKANYYAIGAYSGTPLVIGSTDGTGPDVLSFPMTAFTKHSIGGNVVTRFGGDKAHQNTPLSIAAYGWKRTA